MEKQILRIKKPGGSHNPHTHITDVYVLGGQKLPQLGISYKPVFATGLTNILGTWVHVEDVIREIEAGTAFYYTDQHSKKAYVEAYSLPALGAYNNSLFPGIRSLFPASAPIRHKYIRTRADNTTLDNLLSLPNDYSS